MSPDLLPDIVLIKKCFGNRQKRHRKRNWKLKTLRKDEEGLDTDKADRDYMGFLEDLEEDMDYRKNVNIYLDRNKEIAVESSDEDDAPRISLQEMLDDLHLTDAEDDQEVGGAAGSTATF